MKSDEVFSRFCSISVRKNRNVYSFYKPLLLLYALSLCYSGKERLHEFSKIEVALNGIADKLLNESGYRNFHYAFGRLENDGVWEIKNSKALTRSSSGDLKKTELVTKNICGGFTAEIFQALQGDRNLISAIAVYLINRYFPQEQHPRLLSAFDLPLVDITTSSMAVSDVKPIYKNNKIKDEMNSGEINMGARQNGYIAYLNSLHNIAANSANALAESQALNHYFAEIYQPFPLVDELYQSLIGSKERVVILTGHAGDGKSTVALDVLKRLRQLPLDKPLDYALNEREEVNHSSGKVTIVKDMSELTAQQRLEWLEQGFAESGTWLIVSNTGPLINSLADFVKNIGGPDDIESDILESLDRPYQNGNLTQHIISGFNKELVVLNMTRLDNVSLGARVLTKMVNHSAWNQCNGCEVEACCPLRLNRNALLAMSKTTEERVQWIYQRLTSYEQRLTLRQMVAHLALSLTGGMSCEKAQNQAKQSTSANNPEAEGLEQTLFCETFFGYRRGESWGAAESLRAIALIKRSVFGGPIAANYERHLLDTGGIEGINLPYELTGIQQRWRKKATEAAGVRWRFALRRMLYIFGQQSGSNKMQSEEFLSTFLQSPRLKDFNRWQNEGELSLENKERRALTKRCLQVLLEIYSGFSASQFEEDNYLYLTLRRSDRVVIQPTQLIVAKLDSLDFSLRYDLLRRVPKLVYRDGAAELPLTLPLLDYIHYRSIGQLGNGLAPIHLAQLEWFRAELLNKANSFPPGQIGLLRSGIDGKVKMHMFVIDEQKQELEKY